MAIIEDTNNKKDQHITKNEYWKTVGERVVRNKLPFGDYCLIPRVVVDTKRDIEELAYDIRNDHKRFKASLVLAKECESQLVILTENKVGISDLDGLSAWLEPMDHFRLRVRNAKRFNPNAKAVRYSGKTLAKACITMQGNYGVIFEFCSPEEAGERVLEILKGGVK